FYREIFLYIDYKKLDLERFGRILMSKLETVYANCSDIEYFANRMYSLWESLPGNIQDIEPFWTLCYADDPLSWGLKNRPETFMNSKRQIFLRIF
ncbi:hypothetical protein, partial [Faecalibaculum rodentium]|uniref:hypothetical protein n=1 Tax=Faecalibaculum rodentium TaxID=1702221 RepID=UPI0033905511